MNEVAQRTVVPGVYYDIPFEDYQRGPGISRSQLLHLAKSPAHFYGKVLNPDRPPGKPSTAPQIAGQMLHCALFEPDKFADRYPIGPDVSTRNTKEWKIFEATLRPDQRGVKLEESEIARAQAASLRRVPEIAEALSSGKGEVTAYWNEPVVIDEETGEVEMVLCRIRLDWVHLIGDGTKVVIVDGKGCGDASPDAFAKTIADQDYDLQDAFYRDGFEKASGLAVEEFVFGQVETEWPYVAGCCFVTPRAVEDARERYRQLLQLYVRCKNENRWPAYTESISMVAPRRWKKKEI